MDPFQLLCGGGARFDKKRFQQDIASFKGGGAADASNGGGSSARAAAALDFFGDIKPTAAAAGSGKRKRRRTRDGDDVDGNGQKGKSGSEASQLKKKRNSRASDSDSDDASSDDDDGSDDDDDDGDGDDDGDDGDGVSPETRLAQHVEKISLYRKSKRIYVKGSDIPDPIVTFDDLESLGAPAKLIETVNVLYSTPTPIQVQAAPVMLADRELFGIAPTGSGKTLGFALPILVALKGPAAKGFRACVLAPTRELAAQIKRVFDQLAAKTRMQIRLLDKANSASRSFDAKTSSLKFDVLISTPMRLVTSLQKQLLSLANVQWLVFDEADRLFENGFEHQIDEVIEACTSPKRRIALFSATMPPRVEELARTVLHNPVRVHIGERNAATVDVEQELVFAGREDGKLIAIRRYIQEGIKPPILIFVQSKSRAIELFNELVYDGINVDVIHAERTQQQRDNVVKQFRAGRVWVLIATDLMARGLDFKGVNVVINYDFPANAVDYIHRVGRTGRAGRRGKAITFFTEADGPSLKSIVNVMRASGCDVPQWMLELKTKRKGKTRTIERDSINTSLNADKQQGKRNSRKKPHSKRGAGDGSAGGGSTGGGSTGGGGGPAAKAGRKGKKDGKRHEKSKK